MERYPVAVPTWLTWLIGILGLPLIAAIIAAMIWDNILRRLFKAAWGWIRSIPGWAKRLLGPVPVDDKELEIKLREQSPVVIRFSSELPSLSVWFNLSSKSQLDLVLDRMLVEVWFTQPTIFNGWVLTRPTLPRMGELIETVYYLTTLDASQQDQLRRRAKWDRDKNEFRLDEVTVYVKAWFWSERSGWFVSSRRTTVVTDVPVIGMQQKAQTADEKNQSTDDGDNRSEHRAAINSALIDLTSALTQYARHGEDRGFYQELVPTMMRAIATLRVQCPQLTGRLNEVSRVIGEKNHYFDVGWAQTNLIDPLMLDAQQCS
jgi:hypothetical protein